jgi:hypothetical protein
VTLNAFNYYGSFFIETEAVLGMKSRDTDYAQRVVNQMTPAERRQFRRDLFDLYSIVGLGLPTLEDLEEMMGELMRIANDTARS